MYWHKAGQGSVMLTGNEVKQFGEIVRELMRDDTTFNNFTIKELETLTQDSLADSIRKANFRDYVVRVVTEMCSNGQSPLNVLGSRLNDV
jgi:hypothetical protein